MHYQLEEALQPIYGEGATAQLERYTAALAAYRAHYGTHGPLSIFRAPGRVNLIGEHTDYNHGFVMPAALDKDVLLLVRPNADGLIRLANFEAGFTPVSFPISRAIPSAPPGDWSNYVRGAAQTLTQVMGKPAPGVDALVVGAPPYGVPRGAGLSSSSAFTVVAAVALAHLSGWPTNGSPFAQLCSDAEWYVGTRGGIMDQFVSLFSERSHALCLDCRPDTAGNYHYTTIPLPTAYRLLVVDSGVHHGNVRGEFNQRVAACRAGVAILQAERPTITHLRDLHEEDWQTLAAQLPETATAAALQAQGFHLGEIPGLDPNAPLRVRACCRHVWTENHRVEAAQRALKQGEIGELGRLLNAAHASARDDYSISCPELEILTQSAYEVDGVAGARLTGAGWGGCMVALVHADAVTDFENHIQQRFQAQVGRIPAIFPCQAGPGAGHVLTM
ncbi:MAG: galactokinase [Caldilineaceae bacterium]|nr:galactokinase [Caldilineaceae bacterium]